MKNLILILFIAFAYFIFPAKAAACSCLLKTSPAGVSEAEKSKLMAQEIKLDFDKTNIVFSGEVIEIVSKGETETTPADHFEIRLKVQRIWKGINSTEEIKIATPSSCLRYNFEVGKSFLVYASDDRKTNLLWTNMCAGTLPLESATATDVLKIIGKGKRVKPKK